MTKFTEVLENVRGFMRDTAYPLEDELRNLSSEDGQTVIEAARSAARDAGLWVLHLPEPWGGPGFALEEFARISEELGRSPWGHYLCNCQAPDVGNMEILIARGTAPQQEAFLKPLVAGDIRSCFSMTEPDTAGSNPTELKTVATREGDRYVINGHKWFTSSADGASFAIAMVVTDPDESNKYRRASQIIVPTDTPGFELVRNIPVMGEAGRGWASHAEVRYTDCRVPVRNLLGAEGDGFAIAQERLGPGRIHHCMRWIGICERAFEMMCERAVSRRVADDAMLSDRQSVQNWIADSRAEIDAARLMVLDVARTIDQEGVDAAKVGVSTIKFFVANVLDRVLDRSLQTHGALGMTDDTVLAWWYRHERAARIYDGPDEVHRSRVARQILKAYHDRS
jgi:acyl-CoA dehydrogenase